MSNLAGRELYKYDWRAEVFLRKYQERQPFTLTNGKTVTFTVDKSVVSTVKGRKPTTGIEMLATDGKQYKFKDLAKDADFGGKGAGAGTAKEDKELLSLIDQMNAVKKKLKVGTLKFKINGKIYDVSDAASTYGTPKSDFHLVDPKGNEIVWISHKDGKSAKDFQQWGGISQRSEPKIFAHKETQKFIDDLKKDFPDGLPRATTLYRKIKDKRLKMMSVYGNMYGNALGQQNVSMLLQGPVKLVNRGKYYDITSTHVHYNGDSVDADGYEPVFMAIYKGDRSDAGVKGTRIVISPIMGRKGVEYK